MLHVIVFLGIFLQVSSEQVLSGFKPLSGLQEITYQFDTCRFDV